MTSFEILSYRIIIEFTPLFSRQEVINRLQTDHQLVILVTNNLTDYIDKTREVVAGNDKNISETRIFDHFALVSNLPTLLGAYTCVYTFMFS